MKFKCELFVTLTKLLVIAIAVAGLQACALVVPAPVLRPVVAAPLLVGINEGPAVPPDVVAHYCAFTRDVVVRTPIRSIHDAIVSIDTIRSCSRLSSLWLVETADRALVQQLAGLLAAGLSPAPWGIELGNERDLAGLTPSQFADFVGAGFQALTAAGFGGHILTGGIYTVDDHQPQAFEAYLAPAMAACPACVVGLHWYGATSDTWLARVQALGRPVAVTEFGMPSCTPAQDVAQAAYVDEKLSAFRRTGNVLVAILYQHNSADRPCDNSDASHLAHFGSRRPDGSYKPVDDVLARGGR